MRFLRYPGSKRKFYNNLSKCLPKAGEIKGRYIEPFVGGGSIFLAYEPGKAILSDINSDLIDLYKGIKQYPHKVWEVFSDFPSTKNSYYKIRDSEYKKKRVWYRAARILYLNRTCFKGMWRHGSTGNFSVGYGGEERRWAINHNNIIGLSIRFKKAEIFKSDYENILKEVKNDDFIFLDPPYKPGERELKEAHYSYARFTFDDQKKLAGILKEISSKKKIKWLMTNSNHPDIKKLYKKDFHIKNLKLGTSDRLGISTTFPKEIIIKNF
jgi:DNA adenine methylase